MADLTGSKLKFRKGMKEAGVPEDEDIPQAPAAPATPASGPRFGKQFTPAERQAQSAKLAQMLRNR